MTLIDQINKLPRYTMAHCNEFGDDYANGCCIIAEPSNASDMLMARGETWLRASDVLKLMEGAARPIAAPSLEEEIARPRGAPAQRPTAEGPHSVSAQQENLRRLLSRIRAIREEVAGPRHRDVDLNWQLGRFVDEFERALGAGSSDLDAIINISPISLGVR